MVEISKKDWKLYRERLPEWQEHFMERLVKEYIELLSAPGNASDHFWELEERIRKDKKNPGVLLNVTKSNAIWDIAAFIGRGIITMDELDGFSPDLIEGVKLILSR
ncbi:MAG TPA: multidrug transporter [Candidatus Eisenbergiella merdipullorum]|uniref:Multidrug transporter n=1 Tax=Candidatus Eisenbergiella merdipullorum TaxID=2838553 RepID=A0A9D2L0T2_9FIRM|nr:multidrug transporter [Candidatus Eisenbergiella merdipullorum]